MEGVWGSGGDRLGDGEHVEWKKEIVFQKDEMKDKVIGRKRGWQRGKSVRRIINRSTGQLREGSTGIEEIYSLILMNWSLQYAKLYHEWSQGTQYPMATRHQMPYRLRRNQGSQKEFGNCGAFQGRGLMCEWQLSAKRASVQYLVYLFIIIYYWLYYYVVHNKHIIIN